MTLSRTYFPIMKKASKHRLLRPGSLCLASELPWISCLYLERDDENKRALISSSLCFTGTMLNNVKSRQPCSCKKTLGEWTEITFLFGVRVCVCVCETHCMHVHTRGCVKPVYVHANTEGANARLPVTCVHSCCRDCLCVHVQLKVCA